MSVAAQETHIIPIDRRLTSAVGIVEGDHRVLEEACAPVVFHIGSSATANYYRAHSGQPSDTLPYMGGTRIGGSVSQLPGLAYDMLLKGVPGAKTLIIPKHSRLSDKELTQIPVHYAEFMHDAGFAGHRVDVPGADSGFVAPMTDAYAERYHQLEPDDPYWMASISSKSEGFGGLPGRVLATGRGVYATLHFIDELMVGDTPRANSPRSVAIEGVGAVGGATAMFIAQDNLNPDSNQTRFTVDKINDQFSTLVVVRDPFQTGMQITQEMFDAVCISPAMRGKDKLVALKQMIEERQPGLVLAHLPDARAIYETSCDYFIPCGVLKHSINSDNVNRVRERINIAAVEGGNDVTEPESAPHLERTGLVRASDFMSNRRGVWGSVLEINQNVAAVDGGPGGAQQLSLQEVMDETDREQLRYLRSIRDLQIGLAEDGIAFSLADTAKAHRLAELAVSVGILDEETVPPAMQRQIQD